MELDEVLESLRSGRISTRKAAGLLSLDVIKKAGSFARIDASRQRRRGSPEVVLADAKTPAETRAIAVRLLDASGQVLVSRVRPSQRAGLVAALRARGARIAPARRTTAVLARKRAAAPARGRVGILAAGTSDVGVAEEARLMCEAMRCRCEIRYDVGVAGMHRLFGALEDMIAADVGAIVAVAGMEGALATVVSSLTDIPVIGVPTSVGYGHGRRGAAALASMLQSCSPGLAVVNIDNGIGGGAAAASIALRVR